jgi:hypothetical protein
MCLKIEGGGQVFFGFTGLTTPTGEFVSLRNGYVVISLKHGTARLVLAPYANYNDIIDRAARHLRRCPIVENVMIV